MNGAHRMTNTFMLPLGLACLATYSAVSLEPGRILPPSSWPAVSVCIWMAFVLVRGWEHMSIWDKRQLLWGVLAAIAFQRFLLLDPEFKVQYMTGIASTLWCMHLTWWQVDRCIRVVVSQVTTLTSGMLLGQITMGDAACPMQCSHRIGLLQ